ncbi:MAG: hypothetical protein ACQESR_10775 [Planctomycetota bacterium]
MSYKIRIDPDAFRFITTPIPPHVMEQLKFRLKQMAEAPTLHLRKPPVNLAIGAMMFETMIDDWPYRYRFMADVKYGSDEQTLLIARFGLTRYRMPGEEDRPLFD